MVAVVLQLLNHGENVNRIAQVCEVSVAFVLTVFAMRSSLKVS